MFNTPVLATENEHTFCIKAIFEINTNIIKLFYIFKRYVVLILKGGVLKGNTNIPINYKDRLFRAVACLLVAHFIVMMGRPNLSMFEAFLIPSYYRTLLINYGIALILAFTVKKITVLLDRKHEWYKDIWRRAILQFTFGIVAVSILSFFLVWLYFLAFGRDILVSGYLDFELPFSIALITILNFYYVTYYFYMSLRQIKTPEKQQIEGQADNSGIRPSISNTVPGNASVNESNIMAGELHLRTDTSADISGMKIFKPSAKKEIKEILIIDTPARSIIVKMKDAAMFFIFNKTVFLCMKGTKNLNECLQLSFTMFEIQNMVDETLFFRINRQCLINFSIIEAYEIYGEKGLLISTKFDFENLGGIDKNIWTKIFTVTVDRVADFKNWMDR